MGVLEPAPPVPPRVAVEVIVLCCSDDDCVDDWREVVDETLEVVDRELEVVVDAATEGTTIVSPSPSVVV